MSISRVSVASSPAPMPLKVSLARSLSLPPSLSSHFSLLSLSRSRASLPPLPLHFRCPLSSSSSALFCFANSLLFTLPLPLLHLIPYAPITQHPTHSHLNYGPLPLQPNSLDYPITLLHPHHPTLTAPAVLITLDAPVIWIIQEVSSSCVGPLFETRATPRIFTHVVASSQVVCSYTHNAANLLTRGGTCRNSVHRAVHRKQIVFSLAIQAPCSLSPHAVVHTQHTHPRVTSRRFYRLTLSAPLFLPPPLRFRTH